MGFQNENPNSSPNPILFSPQPPSLLRNVSHRIPHRLLRRLPPLVPKLRPEAASCFISLLHGTPAVLFASLSILSDPSRGFASPNTDPQDSALDYSIAYFSMDLVHYLIFYPSDLLFIGHHLATLFVFVTCRYLVAHGAFAILVLLILAEVTSFCQNTWTLASARRGDLEVARESMIRFYLSGAADHVIPRWVWISWVVVVVSAISVSILWISNLWVELYRERTGKIVKKVT
ncbi:DNA-binding storekeeper-like protein [Actinidia rufa]|uniref:DNA-binding storekeeper-like protein n=1 Tax=Actinidia rufa TaxID=165716 RepID=A0A7J0ELJ8_9ERIC|nr:DNA-binding storekeeper-like protein [Actinidia rufa]